MFSLCSLQGATTISCGVKTVVLDLPLIKLAVASYQLSITDGRIRMVGL